MKDFGSFPVLAGHLGVDVYHPCVAALFGAKVHAVGEYAVFARRAQVYVSEYSRAGVPTRVRGLVMNYDFKLVFPLDGIFKGHIKARVAVLPLKNLFPVQKNLAVHVHSVKPNYVHAVFYIVEHKLLFVKAIPVRIKIAGVMNQPVVRNVNRLIVAFFGMLPHLDKGKAPAVVKQCLFHKPLLSMRGIFLNALL